MKETFFAFILEKQSSGVQKIGKQKKKGNWWFCVVFYGNDLLETLNGIQFPGGQQESVYGDGSKGFV